MLESSEEPKFYQGRGLRVMSFQFVERVLDGDEFLHAVVGDEKVFAQFFPRTSAVAFEPLSGAGALDKDTGGFAICREFE